MGSNGLNVIKLLAEYHCCPAPEAAKELPRHPKANSTRLFLKISIGLSIKTKLFSVLMC